jgi:hypothetical protein
MLFIGTPLYENKVSTNYLHGLMQTTNILNRHNIKVEYAFERGTYIAINREKLVRRFMKTNNPYFLFIDADTSFTAKNVLDLLSTEAEVVSGLYSYRMQVENPVKHCFRDMKSKTIDTSATAPIQECAFVPTGMLLIQRNVFEQLYTKHEFIFDQGFRDSEYFKALWGNDGDELMARFEGEDCHFCKIWHEMGGKMFVNPNVRVGHIGEYVYNV